MFFSVSRTAGIAAKVLFSLAVIAAISVTDLRAGTYGELDSSFQADLIQDNQAFGNVVTIQPDGKVLYAGFFLTINGQPRSYIARFNADGTLDASFDTGNAFAFDASISAVAVQPDGRIIVAGSFDKVGGLTRYSVARLNSDGSFDPSFNVGFAAKVTSVTSVAVQTDGKVLIGGNFSSISSSTRNGFARLNSDGTLDTAFNTTCSAFSNKAIILQPDGKIVLGSSCGASSSGVSRLTTTGTVDATFDAGTGANGSAVTALALQPDGKLFVGGKFGTFNGVSRRGIVRVNANGTLDNTFVPATNYNTNAIALRSDGKVLIARDFSFQGSPAMNRLNADGTNDATFVASETQVNDIYSIAVAVDGSVYEAGKMIIDGPNFSTVPQPLLRLTAAGVIDTTFRPFVAYGSLSAGVSCVVPQPDGKVIVAGQFRTANGIARSALVRFNADGTLDSSFGPVTGLASGSINVVTLQPDGKILIGSSLPTAGADRLMRLNSDGTRDTSFNVVVGDSGDAVKYIALQPDGRILVAGTFTTIGGQTRNSHFARLNANGSVDAFDPTFGGQNYVSSLLVQPDGKFVIGGNFSTINGVNRGTSARFNVDGTLDPTFVNTDFGFSTANYVAILPDGKFLMTNPGTLVRFNANNTQDTTFVSTAFRVTGNTTGSINSVAIQSNGKILVGGQFDFITATGFPVRKNFARLEADGSLDIGFGTYGGATGGNVNKIAVGSDGRILIGGVFKMVNGFGHSGLARLNQVPFQVTRTADFDGDGRTDASVYRNNIWYISPSASPAAFYGVQFGVATDKLAPADYDGDGRTDIAVWRDNGAGQQAYFYILRSSDGTLVTDAFGVGGDIVTVGDWDGDHKADPAVFRSAAQSNFYYRGSLNNPTGGTTFLQWGTAGDVPVQGDFDGDGKLDAAVFRPGDRVWYIRSSLNGSVTNDQFGLTTDLRVVGDYDGDGKSDIAVFRSGAWYILQSSTRQLAYRNFGTAGDTPTPGDYDGDGRTDAAVFRSGTNYVQNSSNAAVVYQPFGAAGDIPVASAYVR